MSVGTGRSPDAGGDVHSDVDGDEAVAAVMAELAEAEQAAEEAEAAARAEALRLGKTDGARRWRPAVSWPAFAAAAAAAFIVMSLVACGWMVWAHRQAATQRAEYAAFVNAARDGVTALLSIDHARAKEDVQRVLDASTGSFKDDFSKNAADFISQAQKSKAVTTGSITAAAVDSVHGGSAVVLLAAKAEVSNSNGARKDPRAFRMSVTVTPDGDQLKMSDVEFVP